MSYFFNTFKVFLATALLFTPLLSLANFVERVNITDGGVEGDGASVLALSVSEDGRYVAFGSDATNLVAGDTNGVRDVFVYDRDSNTIERVSVTDGGVQGNGASARASISNDGRYIAFESTATNLVAGDTNGVLDSFVYDRDSNTIERVSVTDGGVEGSSLSSNPVLSEDGRYVVFYSNATNLVAGDSNGVDDTFIYDRDSNTIERVSVSDAGVQGNANSRRGSVSSDGRYIAFESTATNLVAGDTNSVSDVFVYDRDSNTIERVSVSDAGVQGNGDHGDPSMSSDGRYVTFQSSATNLVAGDTNGQYDIFVYDRDSNTMERVSVSSAGVQGNNFSFTPRISSNGQSVIFNSSATTFVTGDTNAVYDTFVHDRNTNTTQRMSVSSAGVEGNGGSTFDDPNISATGRYAVFASGATNLVAGDTNGRNDTFLVDRGPILTVTTTVTNDNGGTSVVGDFLLFLDGDSITSDVATTTDVGDYTVSQTDDSGYAVTYGGDCDTDGTITMEFGGEYTCTVENDDIAASLTVTTIVINDDQGHSDSGDFSLKLNGVDISSGVATSTSPGTYIVAYSAPADEDTYGVTIGGDCDEDGSIVIALGETYTCTLTANDTNNGSSSGGSRSSSGSAPSSLTPSTSNAPITPFIPSIPITPGVPLTPAQQAIVIAEITAEITAKIEELRAEIVKILREKLEELRDQLAELLAEQAE